MSERIVIIGHGAREHALADKLSRSCTKQSDLMRQVFVIGGNAGIAKEFECLRTDTTNPGEVISICRKLSPNLVVIGPETYLAAGLADELRAYKITTFGPSQSAAKLESSKFFTKQLCQNANILTAKGYRFNDLKAAVDFVESYPQQEMVIKVDGLCAGKGVTVCTSKIEATAHLHHLYNDGFLRMGVTDQTVIIEEYLCGAEVSVFAAATGTDAVLFCPMQDYKRLYEDNQGPNTGGMGSFGPLGINQTQRQSFLHKIKEEVFMPVFWAMKKAQTPFSGLLYAGLMLTEKGFYLLEFNVRFGDPETQSLLFGLKADIYPLLHAIAKEEPLDIDYWQAQLLDMDNTIAIVLASSGYPTTAAIPKPLAVPKILPPNTRLFFAATHIDEDGQLMSGNGRVINVVARAAAVDEAVSLGYELVRKINFDGMQYRHDIGRNLTILT